MPIKVIDDSRTKKIRDKYGHDIFRKWGMTGGNPVLIKQGKIKRSKSK